MGTKSSTFTNFLRLAKPYWWIYVVLLIINISLILLDLAFANNSRVLFSLAPNIGDQAMRIIVTFIVVSVAQLVLNMVHPLLFSYLNEALPFVYNNAQINAVNGMVRKIPNPPIIACNSSTSTISLFNIRVIELTCDSKNNTIVRELPIYANTKVLMLDPMISLPIVMPDLKSSEKVALGI